MSDGFSYSENNEIQNRHRELRGDCRVPGDAFQAAKLEKHLAFSDEVTKQMDGMTATQIVEFIQRIKDNLCQKLVDQIDSGKKQVEFLSVELNTIRNNS